MAKLSLVVPCYNEGENVIPFHEAAVKALGNGELEIVYIDDGSRDATLHNLKKIYARGDCKVKIVSFSRNFGKESGIYAGLEHATGDYICIIDADLQQRPEIVRDMVAILEEQPDVDVVAAYQDRRGEGKVLSFFKRSFYKVITRYRLDMAQTRRNRVNTSMTDAASRTVNLAIHPPNDHTVMGGDGD